MIFLSFVLFVAFVVKTDFFEFNIIGGLQFSRYLSYGFERLGQIFVFLIYNVRLPYRDPVSG